MGYTGSNPVLTTKCPRDGMVVIPALEAGVERRVSSSLTEGTSLKPIRVKE
jgi:hypothetical protein